MYRASTGRRGQTAFVVISYQRDRPIDALCYTLLAADERYARKVAA
jgi:hypothetical protein